MKRQHPFISLFGLLMTVVLLAGIGLSVWFRGGMAFSPGRLSAKRLPGVQLSGFASHTEFEATCSYCHAPVTSPQYILCENCHTEIKVEISTQSGIHGKITTIQQCADCHPEHRGKNFDPGLVGLEKYDHSLTAFSLIRHQVNYDATAMDCAACHTTDHGFSTPEEKCTLCHGTHDQVFMVQHVKDFGANCLDCHDGQDRLAKFDHSKTSFLLEGKHADLNCVQCHTRPTQASVQFTTATFREAPQDCAGCHAEPASHLGVFAADCSLCHTTDSWLPAELDGKPFDHSVDTAFSLVLHSKDYNGNPISCKGCHTTDIHKIDVQTCVTCHAGALDLKKDPSKAEFMQKHTAQYGSKCMDCHDGVDRMSNFNHDQVFPLNGAHKTIDCTDCHKDRMFKGTARECSACHAEPKIHAGFFGLQCQDCHSEQAWTPARLVKHGFPIDHGGNGDVACATCHTHTYTEYTCYGCHDHQPQEIQESHLDAGITLEELPNCTKCHLDGLTHENDH